MSPRWNFSRGVLGLVATVDCAGLASWWVTACHVGRRGIAEGVCNANPAASCIFWEPMKSVFCVDGLTRFHEKFKKLNQLWLLSLLITPSGLSRPTNPPSKTPGNQGNSCMRHPLSNKSGFSVPWNSTFFNQGAQHNIYPSIYLSIYIYLMLCSFKNTHKI